MISYLSGTILTHTKEGAIILVGGVGYECLGSWLTRLPVGELATVYTYHYLENQSIPRLVACVSLAARDLLLQLLSVSGVGPKMASRIIDALPPTRLIKAIQDSDLTTLSSVKGLGKKTAQKIILELGKTLITESAASSPYHEALTSLGFSSLEIARAVDKTDLTNLTDDQAITAILRNLGRNQ